MNQIFTASRMACLQNCLRQHYWSHEVGLSKPTTSLALHFGSAWHRSMEARWRGLNYTKALDIAIPEGVQLDSFWDCYIQSLSIVQTAPSGFHRAVPGTPEVERQRSSWFR